MGYTTDFIGHIDIEPALNEAEIAYLTAFAHSRRCRRADGPYAVPGNSWAETSDEFEGDDYSRTAEGQPTLWCDWIPGWDGSCIAYGGREEFDEPVPWLRYLVAHFLKPGAKASRTGLAEFAEFTFDHRLDGIVVGCHRDTKELFSITVTNNRVSERILRPADQRYVGFPPLPYEAAIDKEPTRRRRRPGAGDVIPIRRGTTGGW